MINERQPAGAPSRFLRGPKPTETAWLAAFRRLYQNTNTRYALLWLTGSILFVAFGKGVIRRREKNVMEEEIGTFIGNKQKKALD